ncbi:MAG: mandelate racemase/muconate lactonizing enzyme family protein [Hyphomicrobiales bacterium]
MTRTGDRMTNDLTITDVIAHPLTQKLPTPTVTSWGAYDRVSCVLVEVRTDDGITGVGETLARFAPKAYCELIDTALKPRILGQPASAIAAHWASMRRALSGRAGGMLLEAMSGIDIALWDIHGQRAGLPLYQLLGGLGRPVVDVYAAAVNWGDDENAKAELERYIDAGFKQIKIKIVSDVEASCRRIEQMRAVAGAQVDLCVDANWAYELDGALKVGDALGANGYVWFEEPLAPEDEDGYEALHAQCITPLAAGESDFVTAQSKRLVGNRTLSILQPDVARSGGITGTRRMIDFAAAHGVAYAPHIGMSGIVCETASVHLAAASPNFRIMECETDGSPFKTQLADLDPGSIRQRGSQVAVPQGPGLGLTIDWDAVRALHPDRESSA